jgi:hypothetical protein
VNSSKQNQHLEKIGIKYNDIRTPRLPIFPASPLSTHRKNQIAKMVSGFNKPLVTGLPASVATIDGSQRKAQYKTKTDYFFYAGMAFTANLICKTTIWNIQPSTMHVDAV